MKKFMNNAGFTLVELIVVIAILGILAAVAVPAYTGYMDKAKEASDTQITSAINTAFAAACMENGETNTSVEATVAVADKKVASINVTKIDGAGVAETLGANPTEADKTADNIEKSFLNYFGDNKNTVLKYYGSFTYSGGNFSGNKA